MKQVFKSMTIAALAAWMPVIAHSAGLEKQWAGAASFENMAGQAVSQLSIEGREYRPPYPVPPVPMPPLPVPHMDAFKGLPECSVVDAKLAAFVTLEEAIRMLKPCMDAVSSRYGVHVAAAKAFPVIQPWMRARPIIRLRVSGHVLHWHPVLRDLNYALDIRNQALLGHPADVLYAGVQLQQTSSLQQVLDRCVLPMFVQSVKSAQEFVDVYGFCLKRAPALKITRLSVMPVIAIVGQKPVVLVLSRAHEAAIQAMNGTVKVSGQDGPFQVLIAAEFDLDHIFFTRGS